MASILSRLKRDSSKPVIGAASNLMRGRLVSAEFFRRHMVQIIFILTLLMVYIANRYDCITGMETIARLTDENEIMKTRLQSERSTYMTSIRESEIKHRADSLGIHVALQAQPPYSFHYTAP